MSQGDNVRMSLADCCRLQAIVADRNIWQKHVRWAKGAVAAATGLGTTTLVAALNMLDGMVPGRCMQCHRHWTHHFTPTPCTWLNADETIFPKVIRRRPQSGSFPSLTGLRKALNRFVKEHNQRPRSFVWTAGPDANFVKVRRRHHALGSMEPWAG